MVGVTRGFWDPVVVLSQGSVMQVFFLKQGLEDTFPVRTPSARGDQVVVLSPYFLYSELDILSQ
jgi:hypothetical protein